MPVQELTRNAVNVLPEGGLEAKLAAYGEAMTSEIGRFPRLFRGAESIPGLTWPTLVFKNQLSVMMGKLEVQILHLGPGHTAGDTIVWIAADDNCEFWEDSLLLKFRLNYGQAKSPPPAKGTG